MEKAGRIIRKSVHTFLLNYQYFTSIAAVIALPFSASVLISQALLPSSFALLPAVYNRLHSLFDVAGFPPSLEFFTILNNKLSQTITSSIFTFPFSLTFLLITKAFVIQSLSHHQKPNTSSHPSFLSTISLYTPLLHTHVYNSFLILSANATVFSLLFIAFNVLEGLGFSSPNTLLFLSVSGAVLYSIVLSNALIICNLALVLSGAQKSGGYLAILKACLLIRGRTSTALCLALPVSLTLAAVEALFQYRIVRAYHFAGKLGSSMAMEGVFLAYLYSILVVLDITVSFMFLQSCKPSSRRIEHRDDEESRGDLKAVKGASMKVLP
ncbi:uncharacterized protein LOC126599575 [Malus sylvestris]|uniref:uncharacterized protein LOC126599575 n=1 Tax=Malus sylvestris TaxID=3752 RepID=UPI0021AC7286|nr:uncharacterized protein LOC126599575 [Malus sylvestris]